jgi:hypothetical protein
MEPKYMIATEVPAYLGVSYYKVWQLIKNNKLPVMKDPLDDRKKLIKVADLDKLKLRGRAK